MGGPIFFLFYNFSDLVTAKKNWVHDPRKAYVQIMNNFHTVPCKGIIYTINAVHQQYAIIGDR